MQKRKMFLSFAFLSTLILSSCTIVANSSQESKQPSSPIESTSIPASSDSESSAPASSETSKPSSSSKNSSSSSSKPTSSSSSSSKPSSSSSSANSSSTSQPPVSEGNFSNITEFNAPVEIHTANQKAYLSYSGNYDQMPENQYPDGSQHRSDSLPVNLSWNYRAPRGKTV